MGETIVVAAIFDFMTVEDWGEKKAPFPPLLGKFQQALSLAKTFARPKKTPALQTNPKHSTKALIIIFSFLTSLLEQEA